MEWWENTVTRNILLDNRVTLRDVRKGGHNTSRALKSLSEYLTSIGLNSTAVGKILNRDRTSIIASKRSFKNGLNAGDPDFIKYTDIMKLRTQADFERIMVILELGRTPENSDELDRALKHLKTL